MDIKKIKLQLKNFTGIKKIVSLKRNISMIQINQLIKKMHFFVRNVLLSKNLIQLIVERNNIESLLWKNESDRVQLNSKKFLEKTLWIYLTIIQKYTKTFYDRTNETILKLHKKQDAYICLGKEAKQFINDHQFHLLESFDDFNNPHTSAKLSRILKYHVLNDGCTNVKFVLNTNKVDDYVVNVFPIKNFDFRFDSEKISKEINELSLDTFKIYPNINEFLEAMITNYFENIVDTMITEASFINYKNKLIEENRQLKQLDELIYKSKLNLIKTLREKEIEEIVMITDGNKRIGEQY